MNFTIPLLYRLIVKDVGAIYINVSEIVIVKNSSVNTQWSTITLNIGNETVTYDCTLSPEELLDDINNYYNQQINLYR